jgi:hypothetical protein
MRFVLFKDSAKVFGPRERLLAQVMLFLLLFFFAVLFGHAQPSHPINPHTGIGWPTGCGGTTPIYNIATNQCVSAGGTAANPAGSSGQLQGNCSGAFCGVGATDTRGSIILNANTQINVLTYGAKGDCITDDHNAIVAAMTVAQSYKTGNSAPAVVYFPKPPGGCYLTSTIEYTGVPFVGQPSGSGTATVSYGVTIRGKPGYDILHVPDPSINGSFTFNQSWLIQDISFLLDRSVTPTTTTVPNLLHRWPGRWFDGGSMTSGSAVITAGGTASIGCNDVGQNILIGGAGATVTTTALAAAITTTTQTSIALTGATSSSWPTIFGYLKVDSEILMYVGTQTNGISTITVMRGQSGTTAATHSSGATVTVMGNLATTVASVDPCWGTSNGGASTWKIVTLAAPAVTTVASAHSYLSLLDLPVATNIGNCAIAFDNNDPKTTDWPNPSQTAGSQYPVMKNINFSSTGGSTSTGTTCSMFNQGAWNQYGLHADHISFYGQSFGVFQGGSEINNFYTTGGDFQHWDHLKFFITRFPWITYNGGESEMDHVEYTTLAGPQFMYAPNNFSDGPGWIINIQELESWSMVNDSRFGVRADSGSYTISGEMSISADTNNQAWLDIRFSTCYCFPGGGQINLFGIGNVFDGLSANSPVNNKGLGNTLLGYNNGFSYPSGIPYPAYTTLTPQKGIPNVLGGQEPDFAADGYPAVPYRHEDLFLWPHDFILGVPGSQAWSSLYQDDANSPSGGEILLKSNGVYQNFQQAYPTNPSHKGFFTIGTNFPAAKGTLYISLLCPGGITSAVPQIEIQSVVAFSQTVTCSASLQTYTIPFDFTGRTGDIGIGNGSVISGHDMWVAWAYIDIAPNMPIGTKVGGTPVATTIAGISPSVGGSALAAGACSLVSSSFTGASVGMAVMATPNTYPGDAFYWRAWVPSTGTVNVTVCAAIAGTPTASTYNVRVIQ